MLIDRYPKEDIFARVPKMTERIDPVLQQLDRLLDDDEVYQQVRSDFGQRYRYTLVHGRHSTPMEVLLRMLLLKHLYGWSYQETEDRVDESLVLRWFCRLFWEPTPDDTTLIRWANTLQPETLHALNDRVVELARQAKVTQGRKLRLDATCVQTEIHHPTDSGLLVDSVRVLSRFVKRAKGLVAEQVRSVEQTCRSRLRSAKRVANSCIGNCGARAKTKRLSRRNCTRSSWRRLNIWCGRPHASSRRWASRPSSRPSACAARPRRCSPW